MYATEETENWNITQKELSPQIGGAAIVVGSCIGASFIVESVYSIPYCHSLIVDIYTSKL